MVVAATRRYRAYWRPRPWTVSAACCARFAARLARLTEALLLVKSLAVALLLVESTLVAREADELATMYWGGAQLKLPAMLLCWGLLPRL